MKALVLVSGGLDSSVALAMAVKNYGKENVTALSITYGQRHDKETECAKEICEHYDVPLYIKDLSDIYSMSNCTLIGHDKVIPVGSYHNQINSQEDGIPSTYVPFRNGLFISYASAFAYMNNIDFVFIAIHRTDSEAAYPDCTPEFSEYMQKAVMYGTGRKVVVKSPFVNMTKANIVETGLSWDVPFDKTWSCYEGSEKPCGKCSTCIDRIEAFKLNGFKDPLNYE